jgi:hypothetical protein
MRSLGVRAIEAGCTDRRRALLRRELALRAFDLEAGSRV